MQRLIEHQPGENPQPDGIPCTPVDSLFKIEQPGEKCDAGHTGMAHHGVQSNAARHAENRRSPEAGRRVAGATAKKQKHPRRTEQHVQIDRHPPAVPGAEQQETGELQPEDRNLRIGKERHAAVIPGSPEGKLEEFQNAPPHHLQIAECPVHIAGKGEAVRAHHQRELSRPDQNQQRNQLPSCCC